MACKYETKGFRFSERRWRYLTWLEEGRELSVDCLRWYAPPSPKESPLFRDYALTASPKTTRNEMGRMAKKGHVEVRDGKYVVTDLGRQWLRDCQAYLG